MRLSKTWGSFPHLMHAWTVQYGDEPPVMRWQADFWHVQFSHTSPRVPRMRQFLHAWFSQKLLRPFDSGSLRVTPIFLCLQLPCFQL
jgi:hypothetical protein